MRQFVRDQSAINCLFFEQNTVPESHSCRSDCDQSRFCSELAQPRIAGHWNIVQGDNSHVIELSLFQFYDYVRVSDRVLAARPAEPRDCRGGNESGPRSVAADVSPVASSESEF